MPRSSTSDPILRNDFINQTEQLESKTFAETTPEQRRAVLRDDR